jgi:hypothetical protein
LCGLLRIRTFVFGVIFELEEGKARFASQITFDVVEIRIETSRAACLHKDCRSHSVRFSLTEVAAYLA